MISLPARAGDWNGDWKLEIRMEMELNSNKSQPGERLETRAMKSLQQTKNQQQQKKIHAKKQKTESIRV